MDLQNQKRLNKKLLLKITIQIIFSVSAFYIMVWYSSSFSIIHPQSLTLLTHTLQRKYMFLICNGILAFLARNSIINSSSSPQPLLSDSHFELVNLPETKAPVSDDMIVVPLESSSQSLEEQQEEYCEEVLEAEEQKEEGITESEACMEKEEEEEKEEEKEVIKLKGEGGITESEVKVTQGDEDELAEETMMTGNEELANTEDLNRKFEEFIRKMKEEMRIEAQRQLIAV